MRATRFLVPALVAPALLAMAAGAAQAQPLASAPRTVPESTFGMKQSFASVVRKAAPAVVNISSKRTVRTQDPFWAMFGARVPQSRVQGSLGSGVIVRPDGVIVTNNHVIEDGQEITVALADRREFPARVLLADPRTDLAVLKIDVPGERLPVLPIDDSTDAQVGDLVLAIGDPFGVGQTVTNGIISALNRSDPSSDAGSAYIQTDAAINPGNSGGALVDMDGELIGVNSFILSRSGGSSGVGFAVPAPVVRRVVETAVGGGHVVVRPWLGARLQSVTPEVGRSLGLARPSGAVVADVWAGGAADRAGLKQGDVIVSVDGKPSVDAASVNYAIGTHRPGEAVRIGVRRGAGEQQLSLRAEPPPASPAKEERLIAGVNPFDGATVVNLSPAVADELGLDPFSGSGVMVTNIARGHAMNAGLQRGDIVREVNGRAIRSVRDLSGVVAARTDVWRVTIERNGRLQTATIQI